jgi:F-type H+-transporting ATPase subunit b
MKQRNRRRLTAWIPGVVLLLTSPCAGWAAEGSETGWGSPFLEIGRFANLVLVVVVLVWAARKPLANFYASRSRSIREQLEEAQQARLEAESKLAEISARMSSLDEELTEIKASAEREAEEERKRILAQAEQDARKLVERARKEIEGMTRAAQMELKSSAAELAVRLATEKIESEITDDDRNRLFARFVDSLGGKA